MSSSKEQMRERRLRLVAAGMCGSCAEPRVVAGGLVGGAALCGICIAKNKVSGERLLAARVAAGLCRRCGGQRVVVEPEPEARVRNRVAVLGGAKRRRRSPAKKPKRAAGTNCAACVARQKARDDARYASRCAARVCAACRQPLLVGSTARQCVACAAKMLAYNRARSRNRRGKRADWGRPPTVEPGFTGRGAVPLGKVASITFGLHPEAVAAVAVLLAAYRAAHGNTSSFYHLSAVLRAAISKVLARGGPVDLGRERLCLRGHHWTLRMPVALYARLTALANERFGGSRARTVRSAVCQAARPPAVVTVTPHPGRSRERFPEGWDD